MSDRSPPTFAETLESSLARLSERQRGLLATGGTLVSVLGFAGPALTGCDTAPADDAVTRAQEVIANALKHAQATEVTVTVSLRDNQVRLVVADNGRGVPDQAERSNHYGLIIMRDRAQSLRGDCQVRRRENGGTEVVVTFIPEKSFSIQ